MWDKERDKEMSAMEGEKWQGGKKLIFLLYGSDLWFYVCGLMEFG